MKHDPDPLILQWSTNFTAVHKFCSGPQILQKSSSDLHIQRIIRKTGLTTYDCEVTYEVHTYLALSARNM
jgi:hypothetical protein